MKHIKLTTGEYLLVEVPEAAKNEPTITTPSTQHGEAEEWSKEKPTFKEDCILLTASWWKDHWETKSFDIYQADGEDENGNPGWYWSVLQDGEECGDIEDLQADLYRVISFPAPPIQKTVKDGK